MRVWMLLCDGEAVGAYTDHCDRTFAGGDILRDDQNCRRRVVEVISAKPPTLSVSYPDSPPSGG
jgi:hypothetical protein